MITEKKGRTTIYKCGKRFEKQQSKKKTKKADKPETEKESPDNINEKENTEG